MDDERRIEQSKVTIRWIVSAILFAGAAYLRRGGSIETSWAVIVGLAAAVTLLNLVFSAVLRRGAPPWLRYVTTGGDIALTSLLVAYSGGSGSPFYYVYFIILVSNSIRYGMAMALFVALAFNIGYVAVLVARPVGGDLTLEGVKILAFWGVALYAGYLATRFQRQARILEAYEETIAGLRARVGEGEPPASAREGR
ncbi:MAG TPA: hypothetical protein VFM39_00555 [bacterium]|nr:hypothetical protein [bacterium]